MSKVVVVHTGVVYKRTSKTSGKSYIGITINETNRNNQWKNMKKRYAGEKIEEARRKYGCDDFSYEVIFFSKSTDLNKLLYLLHYMECYFIKKYDTVNNGYNYNENFHSANYYNFYNSNGAKINQYDLSGNYIKTYNSISKAEEETGASNIGPVCMYWKKGRVTSGGYQWRYYKEFPSSENIDSVDKYRTTKTIKRKKKIVCNSTNTSIVQYSLSGKYIKKFKSIVEASRYISTESNQRTSVIRLSRLCKKCTSKHKYKNFLWRYEKRYCWEK